MCALFDVERQSLLTAAPWNTRHFPLETLHRFSHVVYILQSSLTRLLFNQSINQSIFIYPRQCEQ